MKIEKHGDELRVYSDKPIGKVGRDLIRGKIFDYNSQVEMNKFLSSYQFGKSFEKNKR